ncbi:DddA-like double-stranded DNA deaminase toxin [Streptomyces sp. SCSIO 30461]|uniref:DddA-like double-stranded DNA deaminase toxin n=1 Tax=Streptomyces sp. SCSIO 30461 TaxID=3118085 RepID=UPI00387E4B32
MPSAPAVVPSRGSKLSACRVLACTADTGLVRELAGATQRTSLRAGTWRRSSPTSPKNGANENLTPLVPPSLGGRAPDRQPERRGYSWTLRLSEVNRLPDASEADGSARRYTRGNEACIQNVMGDIEQAEIVINNNKGVCTGRGSCSILVKAILPKGWTLTVHYPGDTKRLVGEGPGRKK